MLHNRGGLKHLKDYQPIRFAPSSAQTGSLNKYKHKHNHFRPISLENKLAIGLDSQTINHISVLNKIEDKRTQINTTKYFVWHSLILKKYFTLW